MRQCEREVGEQLRGQGYSEEEITRCRLESRRDFRRDGHMDAPPSLSWRGALPAYLVGAASGWLVIAWSLLHRPAWKETLWYPLAIFAVTFMVTFAALRWVRRGQANAAARQR